MENNNSSLYAQKAVESFYLDRPYGIRIDYSRKGFVLFNRKLNLLGMDKWNSIEELPLEEYDNPEEIPVEGVDIQRYSSKVDIFFYTDKSSFDQGVPAPVHTITEYWIWSVSKNTTNISTVCQYCWAEPYNKRAVSNMVYCSRLR